jgi:hypothetical protein
VALSRAAVVQGVQGVQRSPSRNPASTLVQHPRGPSRCTLACAQPLSPHSSSRAASAAATQRGRRAEGGARARSGRMRAARSCRMSVNVQQQTCAHEKGGRACSWRHVLASLERSLGAVRTRRACMRNSVRIRSTRERGSRSSVHTGISADEDASSTWVPAAFLSQRPRSRAGRIKSPARHTSETGCHAPYRECLRQNPLKPAVPRDPALGCAARVGEFPWTLSVLQGAGAREVVG